MVPELIYTKKCGETTIVVARSDDCWDVYYTKPMFPFVFAFGLPLVHSLDEVFLVAEGNIENYTNLFN